MDDKIIAQAILLILKKLKSIEKNNQIMSENLNEILDFLRDIKEEK